MGQYSIPFKAKPNAADPVFQRWLSMAHEGIFHAYRWAKDSMESLDLSTEDRLALAKQHPDTCLDTAEWLRAQISKDHPGPTHAMN